MLIHQNHTQCPRNTTYTPKAKNLVHCYCGSIYLFQIELETVLEATIELGTFVGLEERKTGRVQAIKLGQPVYSQVKD